MVWAQKKPAIADKSMGANMEVSLPTMVYNCKHCVWAIGWCLGRHSGVLSYVVDPKARQAKVFFAPDITTEQHIRYAIANAGYQADTVKAEPTAVKLLPVCCRQTIDEEWVKRVKAQEREQATARKIRYRPIRYFLCCELCDYYYKYQVLKDSSLPKYSLRRLR